MASKILLVQKNIDSFIQGLIVVFIELITMSTGVDIRLLRVNGEMYESKHAIEAYCHFLRLLMHFIDIYPELDRAYGYPPDIIVEKFQQRLKSIKEINKYSQFVQVIKMNDVLKSPDDMLGFIKKISRNIKFTRLYENTITK
ncbi:unnamed protein product [Rotaria sp. Silwood2]|nr:unnamed protein product [Rotaria sp. Silwood2]CAF4329228.1 unnamed protein product [Rotaria sp. Silwood2]